MGDKVESIFEELSKASTLVAMVGALASAFLGTFGAQVVISRGQLRQAVSSELNAVSSAALLCVTIANTYMAFRKDFSRPALDAFNKGKDEFLKFLENKEANVAVPAPFRWVADFSQHAVIFSPSELLQETTFQKIGIRGRALDAVTRLRNSEFQLNDAIGRREERSRILAELNSVEQAYRYYGIPDAAQNKDERFKDSVEAIDTYTADCIFFAIVAGTDLCRYGERLRAKYQTKFVRPLPRMDTINWEEAKKTGLVPKDEEYKLWLKGFPQKEAETIIARGLVT